MLASQYMRIESRAGGTQCSARDFVRACHEILNPLGRGRALRDERHGWIKAGLKIRSQVRAY